MTLTQRIDGWDDGGPWTAGAFAALASLSLYVVTACRTVPFGDGGELIAAARSLGVAHPPGYPLYTLLGRLALALPLGEPALRMNLMSSLFAALACGATAWWVTSITRSRIGGIAGGMALAVSSTFWSIATVAEVYSLNVLLMTVVLCAAALVGSATVSDRGRAWAAWIAAVALGLGLAHHPTVVIVLPAAALLAVRGRRLPRLPWPVVVVAVLVCLALPIIFYLGLMLRARLDPLANWGRPVDLQGLWVHATAASYRHLDLGWSGLLRFPALRRLAGMMLWEFTPVILPVAGVGLFGRPRSVRIPSRWRVPAALVVLILAGAAFGLRYTAEDSEVFHLPLILGMALASGLGVAWLRHARSRTWRWAGVAAAVVVVLVPFAAHFRARDLSRMTAAADYGRDVLATVPESAALFVESDDAFPLAYLQQVLGERRDVAIYHRQGFMFRDVVRDVEIAVQPGEPGRSYRIRAEQTFIDRELSRPGSAGVFFLGWPGYEVPPRLRLEPVGLLYRISRADAAQVDDGAVWAGYHERRVRDQAERSGDGFALTIAATYPMARGERALYLGDLERAHAEFDDALRIGRWQAQVHNYIGTLYGRIGDYDRATAMFRRALEVKPTSIRAWNNLAMACRLAGDDDCARDAWSRSLELVPGQGEVRESLSLLPAGPREP